MEVARLGMRAMADGHLFDDDTSWALAERSPRARAP